MDAGILLAQFDVHDYWHSDVTQLWNTHVIAPTTIPALWVNNYVLGEYLNKALRKAKASGAPDNRATRVSIIDPVFKLICNRVLLVLDGASDSAITGLAMFEVGADAGDAFHVGEIKAWGIDLITTDFRLANSLVLEPSLAGRYIYVP